MLVSQSSSHSQPGAGPWEPLAQLQPWALARPWGQERIMVPWVSPAWQGPWPSKEGPLGAGGQPCCGVAEARVDSLSGLMCHPGPWAGQGK